jgi:hypothetical protein
MQESEALIQFRLQRSQAEERIQRMGQGDQSAFEEELISLKEMRMSKFPRVWGDAINCRTHQALQLAEEFYKEFAPKFRELP